MITVASSVNTIINNIDSPDNWSDDRFSALKLMVNGSIIDSRVPTSGKVHFDLWSANAIEVPKNQSIVVSLVADLNSINDEANTGKKLKFALYATKAYSKATGSDLPSKDILWGVKVNDIPTSLWGSPTSKEMVVTKTAPTVATQSIATTSLSNGADKEIYKFTVTADSAWDVALKEFVLQLSGSQGEDNEPLNSDNFSDWIVEKNDVDQDIEFFENTKDWVPSTANDLSEIAIIFDDVQIISAGTSKTFTVNATLANFATDGNTVSASIKDEATANIAAYSYTGLTGTVTNSFIWSDNSGTDESLTDLQWFNGNEVNICNFIIFLYNIFSGCLFSQPLHK